jgi:hypothetical protein
MGLPIFLFFTFFLCVLSVLCGERFDERLTAEVSIRLV